MDIKLDGGTNKCFIIVKDVEDLFIILMQIKRCVITAKIMYIQCQNNF